MSKGGGGPVDTAFWFIFVQLLVVVCAFRGRGCLHVVYTCMHMCVFYCLSVVLDCLPFVCRLVCLFFALLFLSPRIGISLGNMLDRHHVVVRPSSERKGKKGRGSYDAEISLAGGFAGRMVVCVVFFTGGGVPDGLQAR